MGMKLSGILIASTTAQQARQRENKETTGFADYSFGGDDDAFASLYDSFGGDDAFGGFDMSAFNDDGFGSTAAPTVAVATDAPDYGFDLGDAFGDASDSDAAADYLNTVAGDYDGADDAGSLRPEEDDEVKSNFVVDTEVNANEENLFNNDSAGQGAATNEVQDFTNVDIQLAGGANAQKCFVGSAGESYAAGGKTVKDADGVVGNWFTNGVWDICEGENDTCEIKVVRRNERITQIHSKCANRHSCVDNMRQNFNPESNDPAVNNYIFSSWVHQACRPDWFARTGANANVPRWNARQMARDSVCFFCVEPCRDTTVWGNDVTVQTAQQMRDAECVGRAGPVGTANGDGGTPVWNASPIKGNSMKLFNECSNADEANVAAAATFYTSCSDEIADDFGQHVWDPAAPVNNNDNTGPDMKKLNFYSVIDDVMLYNTEANTNHPLSLMQDVSQIQYAQILARNPDNVMTDAVNPNSAQIFEVCGDGAFCYSDDTKLGASVSARANVATLFDGDTNTVYTRESVAASVNEFEIDVVFDAETDFNTLTLTKVLFDPEGAPGIYKGIYSNICLTLTTEAGDEADICSPGGIDSAQATYVFNEGGSTVSGVLSAKIKFDTTGTGTAGEAVEVAELAFA